ncbi:hypothetical protein DXB61_01850 [Parabacteroides merdae]|uniref:Transposase n=1 Tax=Parabacteroides merdae TaxID=46503 RepID=A0AB37LZS9_9BACT|nr:hypothetical protein DXB61_01850 [Parabacteroides merdae]RGT03144.1 hypothetical protein DWX56_05135 [Parabacteroides merdae]
MRSRIALIQGGKYRVLQSHLLSWIVISRYLVGIENLTYFASVKITQEIICSMAKIRQTGKPKQAAITQA